MTQQAYYPPQTQYPAAPPAQYAPAPQQFVQQPQYAPQGYPQVPQAPAPQPAAGSIDQFYSQPTQSGGPSIAWSSNNGTVQKPIGTTYSGIIARDILDGDIQQDSDPKTGQLKTYRDGRPKFFMKIPLRVQPSEEFPEGEATWYVRSQARDELARSMQEAGVTGAPKGGDAISIQLVERRPSRGGGMPANIVRVVYAREGQPVGVPAPVEQPVQYAQPVQTAQPVNVAPVAPVAAPVQAPVAQAPAVAPQPPAGMPADQAALLAQITGQQG